MKAKTIYAVGLAVAAVMLLVPPWMYTLHVRNSYGDGRSDACDIEKAAGYRPIFWAPATWSDWGTKIDATRLALQLLGLATLTALAALLAQRSRPVNVAAGEPLWEPKDLPDSSTFQEGIVDRGRGPAR